MAIKIGARGILKAAWKKDFKDIVGAPLKPEVKAAVGKLFEECWETARPAGETVEACLERVAANQKLGGIVRRIYAEKRAELKGTTAWDWNTLLFALGEALKSEAKARVAAAYKECTERAGITPRDCYAEAAAAQKLGDAIKDAWARISVEITV